MDPHRSVILLSIRPDTGEMEELVRSLGHPIVERVIQARSRPDPGTFLGSGKLEELRRRITLGAPPFVSDARPLVVVDAALKPPQLFGIEDILRIEAWDRIRVILEIFQQKAQVKEARLQVELARLRYELPFVHEALHRTLTGEHPGFMGGGELPMRTYETHLKRRTRKIQQELKSVQKERAQRRAGRRKSGFHLVAIAGYTNSGKSSLLNALCASDVVVESRYFSTLQTTTRRLRPELVHGRHPNLLFTDTVGFIRALPPWLIDAFASTLEEVSQADVILLTVDVSEPTHTIRSKLETAWALLDELHAPPLRILVLNKADLLPPSFRTDIRTTLSLSAFFPRVEKVWVSAKTHEGLADLVQLLLERTVPYQHLRIELDELQPGHASYESWLRDHSEILNEEHRNGRTELVVRCSREEYPRLWSQGQKIHARLVEIDSTGSKGGAPVSP